MNQDSPGATGPGNEGGTAEPQRGEKPGEPEIRVMELGPFQANCYLVTDPATRETVVIDPGAEPKTILKVIADASLKVVAIVNTHGHVDHVGADGPVREATGAPVLIHKDDASMLQSPLLNLSSLLPGGGGKRIDPDRRLGEGDRITLGGLELQVRHTPGHTQGGISLVLDREPEAPSLCFSGDTLFAGSIGRTDFPGGDWETLETSIRKVIYSLPDRTVVLPGHGPETSVGREKRGNAFVRE